MAPANASLPRGTVTLAALSELGLVLPLAGNPLRLEIEAAAAEQGITLDVTVEVEGIRLIADLVAAGAGASGAAGDGGSRRARERSDHAGGRDAAASPRDHQPARRVPLDRRPRRA